MQILNRLADYDQRIFLWCASFSHAKNLHAAARIVSRTGDGYLQVILPLLIWGYAGASAFTFVNVLVLAFVVERSLYWLLKNSLKRRRPPAAIPRFKSVITASDEFSFPSGHTSGAFVLAILVSSYIPVLAIPLFIWVACVGLSRVILGVHFPADIIAGMTLGGSIAMFFQQAFLS